MSPSQMFQERIVINMSRKFITAITFHFFLFYSYCSSQKSYLFLFLQIQGYEETSGYDPSHGGKSFWKVYNFPSKSKWKPGEPVGRINQPKKSYSGHHHRHFQTHSHFRFSHHPFYQQPGGRTAPYFSTPILSGLFTLTGPKLTTLLSLLCPFKIYPSVVLRTQDLRGGNRCVIRTYEYMVLHHVNLYNWHQVDLTPDFMK